MSRAAPQQPSGPPQIKLQYTEHIHALCSNLPNILFPRESSRANVTERSATGLLSTKKLLSNNATKSSGNDLKRYHVSKIERIRNVGEILGGEDVEFVQRICGKSFEERRDAKNADNDGKEADASDGSSIEDETNAQTGFLLKQLAKESEHYTRQLQHFVIEDTAQYATKFTSDIDALQKQLKEDSIGFEKELLAQWDQKNRELRVDFETKKEKYELDKLQKRIEEIKEQIREVREETKAIGANTQEQTA